MFPDCEAIPQEVILRTNSNQRIHFIPFSYNGMAANQSVTRRGGNKSAQHVERGAFASAIGP